MMPLKNGKTFGLLQLAWVEVDIIDGVMSFMKCTVCEVVTS
jgi:hypothetical protein